MPTKALTKEQVTRLEADTGPYRLDHECAAEAALRRISELESANASLEAETKRLAARADELESWMETVLNYYPHLEDGAPTGARADAAHPEGRNA